MILDKRPLLNSTEGHAGTIHQHQIPVCRKELKRPAGAARTERSECAEVKHVEAAADH